MPIEIIMFALNQLVELLPPIDYHKFVELTIIFQAISQLKVYSSKHQQDSTMLDEWPKLYYSLKIFWFTISFNLLTKEELVIRDILPICLYVKVWFRAAVAPCLATSEGLGQKKKDN